MVWSILLVYFSSLLYGQMYDPFRKTAKHKTALAPTATLLPPPPLRAGGMIPPPMMPIVVIPKPAPPPTLVSAIMNNKAFINGAWYRVGDQVNNHEVTYIQNNFVGLKQANRLTMIAVGSTRHVLTSKEIP